MPFDGTGHEGRIDALDKMDKVIDLLSREVRWCKQQLRSYDGRRCILGAMMAADATVGMRNRDSARVSGFRAIAAKQARNTGSSSGRRPG